MSECEHKEGKVIDSRWTHGGKRRVRQCNDCGERYSTLEIALTDYGSNSISLEQRLKKQLTIDAHNNAIAEVIKTIQNMEMQSE